MWVDIPPDVATVLEERAVALNLPLDAIVIAAIANTLGVHGIASRPSPAEPLWDAVGRLVDEGYCDAEIADLTRYTPGYVATVRRRMGKPANRRHTRTNLD